MAYNRNRGLRMRCAFCNKGAFVSVPLKDRRIDLCTKHIDIIGCDQTKHEGDYHSVECRTLPMAEAK